MNKETRIVNVRNIPMMVYESPEIISDHIVNYNRFYESDIMEKWLHYFPSEGLMLDVGANIGNHSLMFKSHFPNLEIWAFEPNFDNFSLLRQNVKNLSNVNSFNFGIGSATGPVNFDKPDYNNYGSVGISSDGPDVNFVMRLDDIKLYDKNISFIKLDVEGHEYSVIEGMVNIIIKYSPVIWLEDYTNNAVELLKSYGYIVQDFEPDANFLMIKPK